MIKVDNAISSDVTKQQRKLQSLFDSQVTKNNYKKDKKKNVQIPMIQEVQNTIKASQHLGTCTANCKSFRSGVNIL